ncbi:MAG: ATP-binding protein [Desulfotignum sp.]|jgi:PAS domain S-box-containing protein|nr:ATP-binding protein [Desulfotignum sp.]
MEKQMVNLYDKINPVWHVLEKKLLPAYVWETDPFTFWQERILFIICFTASFFGPFVLVPSILLSMAEGLGSVAILDLAAYLGTVVVLFSKKLSLKIRASLIFIVLFSLGTGLMVILGPVGAGYVWLLGASIIVSTIYDLKAAFITLACNALAFGVIAVFIGNGTLHWDIPSENPLEQWLVMTGNFLFINALISTTTALMLHSLKKTFEKEQAARKNLQQSEARLHAVFDAVQSIPIQGYDKARKVIFWNQASERVYGYSREQAFGRRLEDLIIPDDMRAQTVKAIQAWYENGIPIPAGEMVLQNRSGKPVPIFSSHVMITSHAGEKEMFCIDLDLSDYKQMQKEKDRVEEQYRQIQKMESIGRLAGGVAHDLNNLLSPILGYSELILADPGITEKQQKKINTVLQAGLRARDLVRQLLAFSRKQTLAVKPVDINQAVKNFQPLLQRTIRENIHITLALSADPQIIMADIGQLEQVIMNLVVNAADAMPDGGYLTIETARKDLDTSYAQSRQGVVPGNYALLAVSDTGSGMDEQTCQNIFEPFFSTKGDQGTGLGLATVYGIVKQHGGNIWVYSEPEKGTTFKIYLPLAQDMEMKLSAAGGTENNLTGTETILLVEDNEQVRELAHAVLKNKGYTVLAAANGEKALETVSGHEGKIHMILTDVVMPGLNGKDLYLKVSKTHPGIKVLYMSGYTSNVIAHHGILEKGIQFIQKPFSINGLAARVRQVLDAV